MKRSKKPYVKPILASRKVELGVFGDYNAPDDGPSPIIRVIPHPNLHMD